MAQVQIIMSAISRLPIVFGWVDFPAYPRGNQFLPMSFRVLLLLSLCLALPSCSRVKLTMMPAWSTCNDQDPEANYQCTQLEIIRYVSMNTKYPPIAKDAGIQGTVFVEFTVGKDGQVTDLNVTRPVDPRLDAEGLRVVGSLPRFQPALDKGKPASAQFTIPVKFINR